ncbi:MAG: hypothetical protein ACI9MR_002336 [Myxococcota bacterium]|jgi:hypothetical protein
MRFGVPLTLVALHAATTWPAQPAHGFVIVETNQGALVRWDLRCVGVWLQPETLAEIPPPVAEAALERAMASWNAVDCAYVKLQGKGGTCFTEVGLASWPGPQNVVSWHDGPGAWPHSDPVVALTSITYDPSDGALVDADIEVNGAGFVFSDDVGGVANAYDLEQTLTHELGHLLGLDHSPVREATMYVSSTAGEVKKRTLDDDDIEALCTNHAMRDAPPAPPCDATAIVASLNDPWCPEEPPAEDCAGAGSGAQGWFLGLALWLMLMLAARRRTMEAARCK